MHFPLEVSASPCCPLVGPSSDLADHIGWSINSSTSPSHLQRLPVVLFRINWREAAGRWTEISFPTHRFCKVYRLSVFWKMHHFRMWSSPCWNCSCLSNEAKSVDNPGLPNWMFCNVDSRIITISRSKSVTRRCSWLVGFAVWLHNHR